MKEKEDFRKRDGITGKKGENPLNKEKLSKHELDELMNEQLYPE